MSIITAPRRDSALSAAAVIGDRTGPHRRRHEVKVRGSGSAELTRVQARYDYVLARHAVAQAAGQPPKA